MPAALLVEWITSVIPLRLNISSILPIAKTFFPAFFKLSELFQSYRIKISIHSSSFHNYIMPARLRHIHSMVKNAVRMQNHGQLCHNAVSLWTTFPSLSLSSLSFNIAACSSLKYWPPETDAIWPRRSSSHFKVDISPVFGGWTKKFAEATSWSAGYPITSSLTSYLPFERAAVTPL